MPTALSTAPHRAALLPLLALALCAWLASPARAQGIPPSIAGLTYDPVGNDYQYTDPITGVVGGPDPNLTYAANPGESFVVTASYFHHTQ